MKIPVSISVYPYFPAGVLKVTGSDARAFLQGQFTNDLNSISPTVSLYGLWLDRKGKVVADGTVIEAGDASEYWIVSTGSPGPVIEGHLGGHIIADDVTLVDETGAWRGLSLFGDGAGNWLRAQSRAGLVFPGRRDSAECWEWVYREADSASVNAAVAGAPVLGRDDVERMRIAAGIPSVPADIGPADLPNEGGLEKVAISYSKGCYLGQEVMARIKSLGRVRRALVRVRGSGAPPDLPAGLWGGERKEGELRSAVRDGGGFCGLALISLPAATSGGALALALGAVPTVELLKGG